MKDFSVIVNNKEELQECYAYFNEITGNNLSTNSEYSYPCVISTQVGIGDRYYDWNMCKDNYTFEEFKEKYLTPIPKIRIESDGVTTRVWVNGVEVKELTYVQFTHDMNDLPTVVFKHDVVGL